MKFKFKDITEEKDVSSILSIYNSNENFLENHMGVKTISREFIINEIKDMYNMNFKSFVIINHNDEIVGVCDYKIGEEVYLSLLMIDSINKSNGIGSLIYHELEEIFKVNNVKSIRIDVVYNYEENVVGFWEKQGFTSCEEIELDWNGYKSKAVKMNKVITS